MRPAGKARLTSRDVETAFGWVCAELQRHGLDVSGLRLECTSYPTSYRVLGRSDAGFYIPAVFPDSGYLGDTAGKAFDRLDGLYAGLIMARQIRTGGTWLDARFDEEGKGNG